jgi:hypothetical protein
MEITELQNNDTLQDACTEGNVQFYGSQSKNLNVIRSFVKKMQIAHGSTYICKQALSVMSFQKSKFCFWLHYLFILEVKQTFTSWCGTLDHRNLTKECNDCG